MDFLENIYGIIMVEIIMLAVFCVAEHKSGNGWHKKVVRDMAIFVGISVLVKEHFAEAVLFIGAAAILVLSFYLAEQCEIEKDRRSYRQKRSQENYFSSQS